MSDIEDLAIALGNMRASEGKAAKDRLVWGAVRNNADSDMRLQAEELSDIVKQAQLYKGSKNPQCGTAVAAEILFKIGLLLD